MLIRPDTPSRSAWRKAGSMTDTIGPVDGLDEDDKHRWARAAAHARPGRDHGERAAAQAATEPGVEVRKAGGHHVEARIARRRPLELVEFRRVRAAEFTVIAHLG